MWYMAYLAAWVLQGVLMGSAENWKLWRCLGITFSTLLIAVIYKYGI